MFYKSMFDGLLSLNNDNDVAKTAQLICDHGLANIFVDHGIENTVEGRGGCVRCKHW